MRPMTFRDYGGAYQLVVTDAADLASLDQLDPARWAATSAPLRDLQCDAVFLQALDGDGKGRIRVKQVVEARDWLFERLARRDRLKDRSDVLILEHLDTTVDAGKRLRAAAEHVLSQLAAVDRTRIGLSEVRAFRRQYNTTLANGDGVVPPDFVLDPDVAALAQDVLRVLPPVKDLSGKDGVGGAQLDRFVERGHAYLAWKGRPDKEPDILPWGPDTAAASSLVDALDAKMDEYFLQCDLAAHEALATGMPRLSGEEINALRSGEPGAIRQHLAQSPLAVPRADGRLHLQGAVNPHYQDQLRVLAEQVLGRVLPDAHAITRADWRTVRGVFAAYRAWRAQEPPEPFHVLTPEHLRGLLEGPLPDRLRAVIAVDQAAAPEVEQVAQLEKLILLQRWLLDLVNNFVNFSAIYHPTDNAMVEVGSLVIDGRRLDFCVKVEDRAAHKKVAAESLLFLTYCAITDKDGAPATYEVAAPVTSGERGRIRVGKRGIFLDVHGREWDATVVDVVENPISVLEAVKAPFRKANQFVSRKIEELAGKELAAVEKKAAENLNKGVTSAAAPPVAPPAPPLGPDGKPVAVAAAPGGFSARELLLGGGLAFAAIGSAMAYVVSALSAIRPLSVVIAVASITAVVGGVGGFLGWLKLRRRDMGLLLEANGWAINVQMKVTRRVGRIFTRVPALPKAHVKDRVELGPQPGENEEERSHTATILVVVLLLAASAGVAWYFLVHQSSAS